MGVVSERRSLWDWAVDYVGDPGSFGRRGEVIAQLLVENGMRPESRVLDVGCGALDTGIPLIRYLEDGHYTGLEPNGWLVEAALREYPELLLRAPNWIWRTDFDALEHAPYDFIVAHSVLSHVAHWQMPLLLQNLRDCVEEGAIFVASYREDQYNTYSPEWVYPGVSRFRFATIRAMGYHAGWLVEQAYDYRERLAAECPNDVHDWLRMRAIPRPSEMNDLRLAEEEREREARELAAITDAEYRRQRDESDAELERSAP